MYSIVNIAGHQYKVRKGDRIRTEHIEASEQGDVELTDVLFVGNGKDVKIGTPTVEGASVKAKVVGTGKGKKKMLFKWKRRKDYHLKKGHRQDYTELEITDIKG